MELAVWGSGDRLHVPGGKTGVAERQVLAQCCTLPDSLESLGSRIFNPKSNSFSCCNLKPLVFLLAEKPVTLTQITQEQCHCV